MKRVIHILILVFIAVNSYAQPITGRANAINTVQDGRLKAKYNLYLPAYDDTATANISTVGNNNIGIDSCGAQIYTRNPQAVWYRACSPKRWVKHLDLSNLGNDFFYDSTCGCIKIDTTALINIINNRIGDSSITSISILNDSTLTICYGNGTCVNIGIVTNITNINSVSFVNDSTVVVCKYDTTEATKVCDTITIGRQPASFIYQNGVRALSGNVVEFGDPTENGGSGQLKHETYLQTGFNKLHFTGTPVYDYVTETKQIQDYQYSSSIAAYLSKGGFYANNNTRLGINYTGAVSLRPPSAADTIDGNFGRGVGYYLGTNARGAGSLGFIIDDTTSKTSGIFFHTQDTATTGAVTIYGIANHPQPTNYPTAGNNNGLLYNHRIASFNNDGTVAFHQYNSTNFTVTDTTRYKPAVFDTTDGTIKKGYWFGGGGSVITSNFSDTSALRASNFYATSGRLIAQMQGFNAAGDGGGFNCYWDASNATADNGISIFKPTSVSGSGRWVKIFNGVVRTKEAGIKTDGTDQTSALNTLFLNATVREVLADTGKITIAGKVDAQGKIFAFRNGAMMMGVAGNADTLSNAIIDADYRVQIFDTSLNAKNIVSSENVVSVRWFGAVADLHYTGSVAAATNNEPMCVKAANAAPELFPGASSYSIKTKLYFPAGAQGYMYRFASYFPLDHGLEMYGDGRQITVLYFGVASKGIWVRYFDSTHSGSQYPYLHDFELIGNYGGTSANYYDSVSHGLTVNTVGGRYERLTITGFDGDGINLHGNVPTDNANNNHFYDIKSTGNGGNGFLSSGGDGNAFNVQDCDFSGNAVAGLFDNSFLGGTVLNTHTSANGYQHPLNRSSVADSTGLYWCIADNSTVHPGVTAGWQNYWYRVADAPTPTYSDAFWHRWDSTLSTTYVKAAGYIANGANQLSGYFSCYSEGDEFASINNGNAIFINGYAAQFGLIAGSLGMKSGIPTMREFQVWDQGSSSTTDDIAIRLDSRQRFLSWLHGTMNFGLKYDSTNHLIGWAESGLGSAGLFVTAPGFDPSLAGRTTIASGSPASVNGFFSQRYNGGGYRNFMLSSSVPATGNWATGDVVFNASGTAGAVLGWRCTAGGTPGTWETIAFPSGGTATLTQYQVGVGDASNLLSGSSNLLFNGSNELIVDGADQGNYKLQVNGNVAVASGQLELSSGSNVGSGGNTAFVIKGIGTDATSGYGELSAYYAGVSFNTPLALQTSSGGSVIVGRTTTLSGYKFLVNADHGKMGHLGANSSVYDFDIGTSGAGYGNGGRINFIGASSANVANITGTYHTSNVGEIKFVTLNGGDFTIRGGNLIMGQVPTTSAGTYDVLTRNTSTGVMEKVASSTFITGITADNGLTASTSTNVQLGGTLSGNTTINTSTFYLKVTGNPSNNGSIYGESTGSQAAIFANNSGSGHAIHAISKGAAPIRGERDDAGTNTVTESVLLWALSQGTAANGFGTKILTQLEAADGSIYTANELITKWTDATAKTSQFSITGLDAGTTRTLMTADGNGGIVMAGAGSPSTTLLVENTTNEGLEIQTTTGTGIATVVQGGLAANFFILPSSTNTVASVINISRGSSGTAADGIGGSIDFYNKTSGTGAGQPLSNQVISKWTTDDNATRISQFKVTGVLSASTVDLLTLNGDGSMQLRPITATAASAITPAEGMIVFVSSTNGTFTSIGFWGYQNAAWHAF